MTTQSLELQIKILGWRERCRPGHPNPMTHEEYKEAIAVLRADRATLAPVSAGSRKTAAAKAKKEKPDGDALLAELDNM